MKNGKQKMVIGIFAIITLVFTVIACDNGGDGIPVHVHQWGVWTVTTPATCIAKGVETRICTLNADHWETRDTDEDPNAHHFNAPTTTLATCEEDGKEEGFCTICNKPAENVLPKLGHNYNWVTTTPSTCSAQGEETGTCTRSDGATTKRPIAKDPNAHQWNNNWVLTTPPTITQEGVETDTCAHKASHKRERSIDTVTITSVADLGIYLSGLSANTKETAYKIALNVSDISTIKTTLDSATDKYVYLDLSGSTITTIGFSSGMVNDGCLTLVGITIPDTVTSIGNWAFAYCTNLLSVTIPNSVTSIGDRAFQNCTNLASVTIPNSVTSIGDRAFQNCTNLASVTIPDSVTSIGDQSFFGCTSLVSVIIGNGVTSISGSAFYRCTSLTSVTIPNSVTSIGGQAFYNCTSLASVIIPNSVTSIGGGGYGGSFSGCTSLASVTFQRNDTTTIPNEIASAFPGDLVTASGGTGAQNRYGTWTTTNPGSNPTWTKQ